MQTSNKKLTLGQKQEALKILLPQIQAVQGRSDLNKFLNLLLTEEEKETVLRRVIAASMLERGIKYRDIQKTLGISRTTISNVRDILEARGYGRNPKRKRAYTYRKKEKRPLLGYYKGARSVL